MAISEALSDLVLQLLFHYHSLSRELRFNFELLFSVTIKASVY